MKLGSLLKKKKNDIFLKESIQLGDTMEFSLRGRSLYNPQFAYYAKHNGIKVFARKISPRGDALAGGIILLGGMNSKFVSQTSEPFLIVGARMVLTEKNAVTSKR